MRSKFQIIKITINVCPLVPVVSDTKKDGSKLIICHISTPSTNNLLSSVRFKHSSNSEGVQYNSPGRSIMEPRAIINSYNARAILF